MSGVWGTTSRVYSVGGLVYRMLRSLMLWSVVTRVVCGITEVDRAEVGATGVVGVWVPWRALRLTVMGGLWGAEVDVDDHECAM